jgi:hypothetical protein
MGNTIMFINDMAAALTPRLHMRDKAFQDKPGLSINGVAPRTVENSPKAFMAALTGFPLRTTMAKKAIIEVAALGMPVKSNLRKEAGGGNGIFHPENFIR